MEQLNKFGQSYALKIRSIKHKCIFRLKKLGNDLIDLFALTFKFTPFARDQIKGVCVTSDDVFSGIARRTAKDNDLRLRN